MARWSSGQDGGLSRRKREFDSPTGHHVERSRHRSVSARRGENSAKSAPFSLAKQNPLRWAFVSNKGPQEIKNLAAAAKPPLAPPDFRRGETKPAALGFCFGNEKMRLHRRHEHH